MTLAKEEEKITPPWVRQSLEGSVKIITLMTLIEN